MCLILRLMPDAFQPRKLAALAAVALVGGGVIGYELSKSDAPSRTAATQASTTRSQPLTTAAPPPCRVNLAALSVTGCRPLKEDTGTARDPTALWGAIDCADDSRHRWIAPGFRRLTVLDGDNVFGERCELGRNDYRPEAGPTFALFREGEHRITFVSLRLPANYPLSNPNSQVVTQMKQTEPADNGEGTPVLALHAEANQWRLFHSSSVDASAETVELWSAPAKAATWTRFAFDVVYSQDPAVGKVRVYADLNGDGDASDRGEQSPQLSTYTLKRESAREDPVQDQLAQGQPIPSHLRVGIYHRETIPCPAPGGCSLDVDDVQVYALP
jgi:hypothetical protein